jgi:peptidoglycan/LPS O-acetylase OafA/YrhL
MRRLRELDFLRGVAILLVLLRHIPLFTITKNIGWIGIDLFFVLSGFLISGLLFKEYLKFGDISPKLFLIRRGFKIYPVYFIFYIPYLIPIIRYIGLDIYGLLADITFTQNYIYGWGYANNPSWSLAIEEHFYFAFTIILWVGLKYKKIVLPLKSNPAITKKSFEIGIIVMMVICLLLRLITAIAFPPPNTILYTATHSRIDSLLMGVLIAYSYNFRKNDLEKLFQLHKNHLLLLALCCLIWTPFIEPISSFFAMTFGFTFLYIAFGILLIFFLLTQNINQVLNLIFSSQVVDVLSKIGYCSYSIYIIHTFIIYCIDSVNLYFRLYINHYLIFLIAATASILTGMIMTYTIEKYFLKKREKYYPARV